MYLKSIKLKTTSQQSDGSNSDKATTKITNDKRVYRWLAVLSDELWGETKRPIKGKHQWEDNTIWGCQRQGSTV